LLNKNRALKQWGLGLINISTLLEKVLHAGKPKAKLFFLK
jgi:hypothetical protein